MSDYIIISNIFQVRAKKAAPLPPVALPAPTVAELNWDRTPCCEVEVECQTWHNPVWVNREKVWSIRGECWIWRPIPQVVEAKSKMVTTDDILDSWDLEAAMHLRDDKETAAWLKSMNNWSDDELDGLLSR